MNGIAIVLTTVIVAAPSPFLSSERRDKPNDTVCPIESVSKLTDKCLEAKIIEKQHFYLKEEGGMDKPTIRLKKGGIYECGAWEGMWFVRSGNLVIISSYRPSYSIVYQYETIFIKLDNVAMLLGHGDLLGTQDNHRVLLKPYIP